MAASVLVIHREFDYINREIDDIYFKYNTLCLYYVFLRFFLHQFCWGYQNIISNGNYLIIFENYNECKTKHLFLIKKVVTRFDKKNNDMAEKQHWWREESNTAYPKEENPISEDSKKTLSLRTLKRILSMRNLKKRYQWGSSRALGPSMNFATQINSFWLFGNGIR